jgi:DNA-binding NarL/FixJ family response regulator
MKRIRLVLADDHTLVSEGLRKLLAPHFDLVETVEDGRELLRKAPLVQPDVVLLDISMPLLNGLAAARRLRKVLPEAKVIFLTMHADPAYVTEAFRAGAAGYVLKRSAASELVHAVHEVMSGRSYVTPLLAEDAPGGVLGVRGVRAGTPGDLSTRQREVLQLLAEGHASKEMAGILDVSVKTVEYHKARLMERLGLRTTAELTRYAVHHGLVSS